MKITFLGAARTVTGSNFLVEAAGKKFLVDCGMYQGKAEEEYENSAPFAFNPSEIDFSTSLYANIATSIILYITIYLSANFIASYLGIQELGIILRIISVVIVINSIGLVPKVKLRRTLAFKQIAIANIIAYIIAAVSAIILAHKGFGVWSLVVMHITNGSN